jgi:hypothetical protein
VYLPKDIEKAWIKFESEQKLKGKRISFQGTIENYLQRLLREYLK